MATLASAAPPPAVEFNPLQKIGFFTLLVFIYAFTSRLLDVSFYYLHVPLILAVVTGLCALASQRFFAGIKTPVGMLYMALTFWFVAGVPFSHWRGGSVQVLREDWQRTLLAWIFVTGLTVSYRESKRLLNAVVLAVLTAAVLAFLGGAESAEGRLALAHGRFGNPNDFAAVLLIGLPFLWRFYADVEHRGLPRRVAALGAGALVLVVLLRGGSRAGLYSLAFMVFLTVLRVSLPRKVQIGMAALVLSAVAFVTLPGNLRVRYFTFSDVQGEEYQSRREAGIAGSAAGSAMNRRMLLGESLSATLRRPVFGVGLGNFAPYTYDRNRAEGRPKEAYNGTHNTYTQISSEAGIPAIGIFIAILLLSWRSLGRVIRASRNDIRPAVRDIHVTAQAMQVCLGAFCFFLFFYHVAYDMLPHLITALAVAVSAAAERELARLNAAPVTPLPAIGYRPPVNSYRRAGTSAPVARN